MHELPPDADDVLALARRAQREPDAEVRARVRRGVAAAVAGGAVIAGTTHAAAASGVGAKAGLSLGLVAKFAAAATVCAVAVGVLVTRQQETSQAAPREAAPHSAALVAPRPEQAGKAPPAAPAHADVVAEPPVLPAPAAVASAPAPSAAPPAAKHASTSKRARPLASEAPSLRAELVLLDAAERALDRGAAARALALLARHRTRYAESSLREEREALTLIARCTIDRETAAADATRFLARAPTSLLQARIESACGVER